MQSELNSFDNMSVAIMSQGRINKNVPLRKFKPLLELAEHFTGLPFNTKRGLRINLRLLDRAINLN